MTQGEELHRLRCQQAMGSKSVVLCSVADTQERAGACRIKFNGKS
jgi:hypothetical protein